MPRNDVTCDRIEITEWTKPGGAVVRLAIDVYNGRPALDIREHYQDEDGQWKPTKKGVRITPDVIDDVTRSIRAFEKWHEKRTSPRPKRVGPRAKGTDLRTLLTNPRELRAREGQDG